MLERGWYYPSQAAWHPGETEASVIEGLVRADEFIAVLRAMWGDDPVEFQGDFFRVPRSIIQPKPIQQPSPPIYLAAYSPRALERVARLADGWLPVAVRIAGLKQMLAGLRTMAEAAGRDPEEIQLIVLAHVILTDQPQGSTRREWAPSMRFAPRSRPCATLAPPSSS